MKTNTESSTKLKKSPQALRLPDDLLARVDAYAERLETEIHVSVSRSDAIRRLLVLGLEDAEDIREAEQSLLESGGVTLAAARAEYDL